MNEKITKAIIPVAGKGTRFMPGTKGISKEVFPVVDTPVLLYILKECADSGITDVLLITRKDKADIKKFLTPDKKLYEELKRKGREGDLKLYNDVISKLKITYKYQRKDLIGTAGAVYVGKKWANNQPFAVLYGDDLNYTPEGTRPAIGQLIDAFNKTGKMVLGCKEVLQKEVFKYGACSIKEKIDESTCLIDGVIEKPKSGTEPSNLVSLARYIMPSNTFKVIETQIPLRKNNAEEICLTDTMDIIIKQEGGAIACVMNSVRYDTGDKLGFLKTTVEYALRDKKLGTEFKEYLKSLKLD